MSLEAMKQALEALEAHADIGIKSDKAITSLRQAIAEAEKQEQGEPVAWMFQHEDTGLTDCVDVQQVEWGFENNNPRWKKIGPLYTTPQQRTWVGLTKNEVEQTLIDHNMGALPHRIDCIRAIEAKLKEKNT